MKNEVYFSWAIVNTICIAWTGKHELIFAIFISLVLVTHLYMGSRCWDSGIDKQSAQGVVSLLAGGAGAVTVIWVCATFDGFVTYVDFYYLFMGIALVIDAMVQECISRNKSENQNTTIITYSPIPNPPHDCSCEAQIAA
jgi:hypothetical protein